MKRARSLLGRNRYHASIVKKHGKENIRVKIIPCSSETRAFSLEKELIARLRLNGVVLANMTDGGEGAAGIPTSAKQKEAVRVFNSTFTSEQRKLARQKEDPSVDLCRAKAMKLAHANMPEDKKLGMSLKMTVANLNSWSNPEIRAKRIAGMKGKKKTMSNEALEQRRLAGYRANQIERN